jgi:iron(III) transport system permease protein
MSQAVSRARHGARLPGFWAWTTLAALLLLLGFLVFPVLNLVAASFGDASAAGGTATGFFEGYLAFFSRRYYFQTLINSLLVSLCATALALLVGIPAAYAVSRYRIAGRALIRTAVVLVFVSPPFIGSYSWVVLFGRSGLVTELFAQWGVMLPSIYGAPGVIFVFALQFFPFVFLLVSSGLKTIDQSVEDAATNLGSGEWRIFRTVLLPLLRPSISTAALLVFIAAFTDIGTPIIIGERLRVLSVLVYSEFVNELGGRPVFASSLALILLAVTTGALLLQRWYARRTGHPMNVVRGLGPLDVPAWKRRTAAALVYLLVGLALLPVVNVVCSSFLQANGPVLVAKFTLDNYRRVLTHLTEPLWNTVLFTTAATLLCAVLGTAIGYIVTRRRGALTGFIDMAVMFAYAVPGIVLGVALVLTYNVPPLVLTGTAFIVVLAYVIRRLPFSVRSASAMLAQQSGDTEEASVNLGAGPGRTFFAVTVPLLLPAIVSGALLTWANTVRELSTTLMLQSARTNTISVEIFNQIVNGNFGVASALGSILVLLTCLPLLLLFYWTDRSQDDLV